MMSANFQVTGDEGYHISDIVPTGYSKNSNYTKANPGGVQGVIVVQLLDEEGGTMVDEDESGEFELKWKWYHTWQTGTGWLNDARWVDGKGDTVVAGSDNDYLFDNGQGLWVACTTGWKTGMNFSFAGEALLDGGELDLVWGSAAMAIPLSCDCPLVNERTGDYNIYPTGYSKNSNYTKANPGGVQGVIVMQILDAEGGTEVDEDEELGEYELKWKWYHTWNSTWQDDARWVDGLGRTVTKDVGQYVFPMGQALWVACTTGWKAGMKMSFAAIDDLK